MDLLVLRSMAGDKIIATYLVRSDFRIPDDIIHPDFANEYYVERFSPMHISNAEELKADMDAEIEDDNL